MYRNSLIADCGCGCGCGSSITRPLLVLPVSYTGSLNWISLLIEIYRCHTLFFICKPHCWWLLTWPHNKTQQWVMIFHTHPNNNKHTTAKRGRKNIPVRQFFLSFPLYRIHSKCTHFLEVKLTLAIVPLKSSIYIELGSGKLKLILARWPWHISGHRG